jgi:O-antigen/teichoic acid export membrane protein
MVIAPHLARLHAAQDTARLQKLVTASARFGLMFAAPVTLVFVVFGRDILELVFGAEYTSAYLPLIILSCGYLLTACVGSVGHILLNMTGFEHEVMRRFGLAVTSNVVFNLAFIPWMGARGAALAAAASMMLWNVVLWRTVTRRLNIDSRAFSLRPGKSRRDG